MDVLAESNHLPKLALMRLALRMSTRPVDGLALPSSTAGPREKAAATKVNPKAILLGDTSHPEIEGSQLLYE